MRQIGFYFLFILSFVNRDIWGMKAEEEEKVNWEEEFNNNYCISDKDMNILNLSDLEELTLSENKKEELKTLNERLNSNEINVVEFCTAEENTIKFKVVEEEEEIDDVTYFSCIDKRKDMENKEKLCIGIVEDTILITKAGKLRNFEDKNKENKETKELFLVKKPVKESIIFDKSFEANNAINDQKTEFELSLLYSTIRNKIQNQTNLQYEDKIHIFLLGYNKLLYYWDNIKKHIYFFQFFTGAKVFHEQPLTDNLIQKLKKYEKCVVYEVQSINKQIPIQNVVHEVQDKNQQILNLDVKENKSCCQKCCDNCF